MADLPFAKAYLRELARTKTNTPVQLPQQDSQEFLTQMATLVKHDKQVSGEIIKTNKRMQKSIDQQDKLAEQNLKIVEQYAKEQMKEVKASKGKRPEKAARTALVGDNKKIGKSDKAELKLLTGIHKQGVSQEKILSDIKRFAAGTYAINQNSVKLLNRIANGDRAAEVKAAEAAADNLDALKKLGEGKPAKGGKSNTFGGSKKPKSGGLDGFIGGAFDLAGKGIAAAAGGLGIKSMFANAPWLMSLKDLFGEKGKLAGIGKKAAKFGKFLKTAPGLGLVITAVTSIFEFFDGFKNAASIIGVDEKNLTVMDKVQGGLAQLVSGLTFGLVKAKDVFEIFDGTFGGVVEVIKNEIAPGIMSIFGGLKELFLEDVMPAIKEYVVPVLGMMAKVFVSFSGYAIKSSLETTAQGIKMVFGREGMLANIFNTIKFGVQEATDALLYVFGGGLVEDFKTMGTRLGMIPSLFGEAWDMYISDPFLGTMRDLGSYLDSSFIQPISQFFDDFSVGSMIDDVVVKFKGFAASFVSLFDKDTLLSALSSVISALPGGSMILKAVGWAKGKTDNAMNQASNYFSPAKGMVDNVRKSIGSGMSTLGNLFFGDSEKDKARIASIKDVSSDPEAKKQLSSIGQIASPTGQSSITATSAFGRRSAPQSKGRTFSKIHRGVDIRAAEGDPIYAMHSGTVKKSPAGTPPGDAWVDVVGDNGFTQRNIHVHQNEALREGGRVEKGQVIGTVASMGTGPHQHLEVMHNGKYIDPAEYIKSGGLALGGKTQSSFPLEPVDPQGKNVSPSLAQKPLETASEKKPPISQSAVKPMSVVSTASAEADQVAMQEKQEREAATQAELGFQKSIVDAYKTLAASQASASKAEPSPAVVGRVSNSDGVDELNNNIARS